MTKYEAAWIWATVIILGLACIYIFVAICRAMNDVGRNKD